MVETAKILTKSARTCFSLRIGNWELILWKITYEAPATAEQEKLAKPTGKQAGEAHQGER